VTYYGLPNLSIVYIVTLLYTLLSPLIASFGADNRRWAHCVELVNLWDVLLTHPFRRPEDLSFKFIIIVYCIPFGLVWSEWILADWSFAELPSWMLAVTPRVLWRARY